METEPVLLTDAVVAAAPSPNNYPRPTPYINNNINNNGTIPAFVDTRASAGSSQSTIPDFRRQMLCLGRDLNSRDIPTIKFLLRGD